MNIFKNLQIKILAVVSALLLWLFVVGVENYVYLYPTDLTVKVMNLGQNVSVANELVKAKVRYKSVDENAGNTLNANEIELFVDAQDLNSGEHILDIAYISKDPKITIVSVEPAHLSLNLEAITSKEIKLKSSVSGSPAKEYEMKELKLSKETIKVSGAASVLANITELPIKITLDGTETADFSRKITAEAPADWNLSGKTISFDPAVIQADIQVRKIPKAAEPINVINGSSTTDTPVTPADTISLKKKTLMAAIVPDADIKTSVIELLPENILVTVEGEQGEIDKLKSDSIKLNLRSSSISKGSYVVKTGDIEVADGIDVKVVEFSPAKVTVKF